MMWRIAWRSLLRQGRRTLLTASAMALGVAMCMAMLAFSDGMYAQMFDVMVTQKLGHVQLHHPDYPGRRLLHDTVPQAALAEARGADGVVAGTARLAAFGLVGSEETSTGVQLLGVAPADEDAVTGIRRHVEQGRFLGEDAPGIEAAIGDELARTLKVGVGDELVAIVQAADGSMGNELLSVVGVVHSGNAAMDRAGLYVHLADLQTLMALPEQAHEILLVGGDVGGSDAVAAAVRAALAGQAAPLLIRSWSEAEPQTAQLMGMQNVGAAIMIGVVFSVASLGVLNTMLMSVMERTRELGLMQALGLSPQQVMRLVLIESVLLGVISCLLGALLGGVLDALLVVYGFDMSGGSGSAMDIQGATLDPVVHGVVRPEGVAVTLLCVFGVSVLAALWPAIRAARLRPIEAMRQT